MTDIVKFVHRVMDKLIKGREYSVDRWRGSRYEMVKSAANTDKGNLAEDLLKELLDDMGYNPVLDESRRGPWDVRVTNGDKDVKFEVKVATQDTNRAHQFNGIRHDTKYTHLFLLGVLPDELRYQLIDKRDRDNYTMTPMRKGSNSDFKITFSSTDLLDFSTFTDKITKILGQPESPGSAWRLS